MPSNYGDVALDLKPDWSRLKLVHDDLFTQQMVGHEGGVADAHLTDEPDAKHQFQWCDPKDEARVNRFRTQGYAFCVLGKGGWTKNEKLWEATADNNIRFLGQNLMARPERLYREEKAKKIEDAERVKLRKNDEAALRLAEKLGFVVEGPDGKPLEQMRRTG